MMERAKRMRMVEISLDNTVASIDQIYTKASTFPCKVTTQSGAQCVMKLKGAGPGPVGLLTEFIALKIAAAMRFTVPSAHPLYLPSSFPWMLGTDEFDGAVQRSPGWNLGIAFIEDAHPATAEEVRCGDAAFLEALIAVDRALANTDRTSRNTNVLSSPTGLVAIDFDACLFLRRAIQGTSPQSHSLWPDHILHQWAASPMQAIPPEPAQLAIQEAPLEWIEAIGFNRSSLASALHRYVTGWNAIAAAGCSPSDANVS